MEVDNKASSHVLTDRIVGAAGAGASPVAVVLHLPALPCGSPGGVLDLDLELSWDFLQRLLDPGQGPVLGLNPRDVSAVSLHNNAELSIHKFNLGAGEQKLYNFK